MKAKQTKLVEEVLRPILHQYGWNLDQMLVQVKYSIYIKIEKIIFNKCVILIVWLGDCLVGRVIVWLVG